MKAKRIDVKVKSVNDGVLWKLDTPVEYEDRDCNTYKTNYVVTSHISNEWACETLAFPSDEIGNVLDWGEIGGEWHVDVSHKQVMESMGYEITDEDFD